MKPCLEQRATQTTVSRPVWNQLSVFVFLKLQTAVAQDVNAKVELAPSCVHCECCVMMFHLQVVAREILSSSKLSKINFDHKFSILT